MCDRASKSEESPEPTKLTTHSCTQSSRSSPWDLGAPPQIWEQYSIHGRMVDLYRYKMDSGVRKWCALWRETTFLEAALAIDCIYGFQYIDLVKVQPSKRKLLLWQFNAIHLQAPRGFLWWLNESSSILVALNVTSHMSPHSTILSRSNSCSPADSTFSKKQTYQDWSREWCHLHILILDRT